MSKRSRLLGVLTLLGLLLSGCRAQAVEPRGKAYFDFFDTVTYVYSYAGDSEAQFTERCAGVAEILGDYHRLFDIYREYAGVNNLFTVNQNAGGDPVQVDHRLIDFLLTARELHALTGGEMNVAMGPVLRIWHEHRTSDSPTVPDEEQLREAELHTDISLLEIDEAASTVRLTDPAASLDVGALGKGYAVERAAEYLQSVGAQGYVINAGGNLRIVGAKPDGEGWVTGVRDPADPDGDFAVRLNLADTACVTSGAYERYFTVNGARYHHIIDRDTLFPADHFASLTVVAKDSALADALSTALFCMPWQDGAELLEGLEGVDALWILPDGELRWTPGLEARIL